LLNKMRDILNKITKSGVIDEKQVNEIVKDLQRTLITADVNVRLVKEVSNKIKKKALEEKLPPGVSRKEHLVKIIYNELVDILGEESYNPRMDKHKILLVGLFGSGKSTAVGKLSKYYLKRGLSTAAITTDTWRPAAYEQVQQLSKQVGFKLLGGKADDAVTILKKGMKESGKEEVLIVDSAGRDSLSEELISEIKQLKKTLNPDEVYLVISADIGQTATKQAQSFNEAVGLTGVIVTKTDSSGRAGGALSACKQAGVPVAFISTGEKPSDFEVFNAEKFVGRLLGFPDLGSLLKKVEEAVEESEFSPEDVLKGDYNLKTFYNQLEAMKKMGPMKKVLEMLGAGNLPSDIVESSEEKLKGFKIIMDSMTKSELEEPSLIKSNRIKRVSKGSGRTEKEVRELLKQYDASKKMIKKVKKGKFRGLPGMRGMPKGMPKDFGNLKF